MSDLPLHLTRNEIAAFVGNDPRAIKAIETLLRAVNTIQASEISTNTRDIKSERVLLWLSM